MMTKFKPTASYRFAAILFAALLSAPLLSRAQTTMQLIRNATLVISYNGHKLLVDPMFSEKGAFQSFAGIQKNPTVDLKVPITEIISSLDLVLVTHTHPDHFDEAATMTLNKSVLLFHQPSDTAYFKNEKFINAQSITASTKWNNIEIIRTDAQHGSGEVLKLMGNVSGYILKSANHPTIYIVGDGIWTNDIKANIQKHKPDYIVINSGGAVIPSFKDTPILMDEAQAISLVKESGNAKVIAVHMESLDHCLVTRTSLRTKAQKANIPDSKLVIPQDGETIELSANSQ